LLRAGNVRLIYYHYAKIITLKAIWAANGKKAKNRRYGFLKEVFQDLEIGIKSLSEMIREKENLLKQRNGAYFTWCFLRPLK